ncbi:MAG: TRAP transporter substrate-binding protein [Treponema sp.]|nr:TRAP transporter substrate-binding protein [Treponema sp.]
MKKLTSCAVALLAVSVFLSCNNKKSDEVTLVMAEVNPATTIAGQMDQAFKEKVEELSGGKMKIDLQCAGILGDVDAVMDLMLKPNSTIQIHRMSAVNLATYGCEKNSLLSIPFTFANKEHFWQFVKSPLAQEILDEPMKKGLSVKGLFFGEEGFRHFFSTKKIVEVSDFEGLKLRTTNDEVMKGVAAGLKTQMVSVGFADLYSAFQTGVVDAAEQPIANYLANHFNEVAPYMILDGHTLGVMEAVITVEAWNALTKDQQRILIEAGAYASEFCRKLSQDEEDRVRAQLEKEGATITDVTNVVPWQAACADVIKNAAAVDPALYQNILNLVK